MSSVTLLMQRWRQLWHYVSSIGVDDQDFEFARKITLANQVAFCAFLVPLLYNILYLVYDAAGLLPVIIINLLGSLLSLSVLLLNREQHFKFARILIMLGPNIQISLLTLYLSTDSGTHLLHIMMASFALLLVKRDEIWLISIFTVSPVLLYLLAHFAFGPEQSLLLVSPALLEFLFITVSLSVFGLVMLFVSLFYKEVLRTEALLQQEYDRSENLLLSILPETIARRLKTEPQTIADRHPAVTVLFADLVGFTELAGQQSAEKLLDMLNHIFSRFDMLVDRYGLEKIKTIGDAYMVAGGIPVPSRNHISAVARLALDMRTEIANLQHIYPNLNLRIGFHTGAVIAGVIGNKKFSYDIWGDTVNIASRMESHGRPGEIHVSAPVYMALKDEFEFEKRGLIEIKGKAKMQTWFLKGYRRD